MVWTNTSIVSTTWDIDTGVGRGWFEFPMFSGPNGFFGLIGSLIDWNKEVPVVTEWEVIS